MTTRTITFDDEQWQVVPREPNEAMVKAGLEASLTANKYLAMLDVAPEPPASMLTQQKLTRAINALGIDSRAGTPDYVLSDAIWAYLHGIPSSVPSDARRTMSFDGVYRGGMLPQNAAKSARNQGFGDETGRIGLGRRRVDGGKGGRRNALSGAAFQAACR